MNMLANLALFGVVFGFVATDAAIAVADDVCPDPLKVLIHNTGCKLEKTIYGSSSSDCPKDAALVGSDVVKVD